MKQVFVALLLSGLVRADALIDAVEGGDRAAVQRLLASGVPVNHTEPDGSTALLYAAHRGAAEIAAMLVRAGAKTDMANSYGANPICEAASAGSADTVEVLLRAGANPRAATPEGETALMSAARSGSERAVRLLAEAGADVNAKESWRGQTALMWAAAADHAGIVRYLLDYRASVDERSALVVPEIKRPANGNLVSEQPKGSMTALLFAAREGAAEAAKELARGHANLNAADSDGITPLIEALINGHYDTAALLIEAGADVNLADAWGRTALYAAVDMNTLEPSTTRPAPRDRDQRSARDIVRMLLDAKAEVNTRLKNATPGRGIPDGPDPLLGEGTTPLLRAAKTGDVETMQVLLAHGADPHLTTAAGVNALMAASGQGWRYGDSQIAESDALQAVEFLLKMDYDVNAENRKHETALHGAADRGADRIVKALVEHGARLDILDSTGHTPLQIAQGGEVRGHPGYPSTAALLQQLETAH